MKRNYLGIEVTRPDKELIIISGVPGCGKTTKGKELMVGDSVMLSIDSVIERGGDYIKFFEDMRKSGDMTPFRSAIRKHLFEFNEHVVRGTDRIIVDNTSLKFKDIKPYVKTALEAGYDDANINIINMGTNGLTAHELAARNVHGVPLEAINRMINRHRSMGDITIAKVMAASDQKPLYCAVVLTNESRAEILSRFSHKIPEDWKKIVHHMTIKFGSGLPEDMIDDLDKPVELTATHLGVSDKAIALAVNGYKSFNTIPHVTLAINPLTGKAVDSNNITDWEPLSEPIRISGIVSEVQ